MTLSRAITATCLLSLVCASLEAQPEPREPFVVMELFTSEGCSSCPPAEKLVNDWVAYADEHDVPVYPLAFHVDYWDGLGWPDRFSSEQYTQRQAAYARAMNLPNVYTPQLVINGRDEFLGSHEQTAADIVRREMRRPAEVAILPEVDWPEDGDLIHVRCELEGITPDHVVNIAVVERGLSNDVAAGENKGRKLTHDNVVRAFAVISPQQAAAGINIKVPHDMNRDKTEVVVYVQNRITFVIVGATAIAINE